MGDVPGDVLVVRQVDVALPGEEVVLLLLGVEDAGDGLLVDDMRRIQLVFILDDVYTAIVGKDGLLWRILSDILARIIFKFIAREINSARTQRISPGDLHTKRGKAFLLISLSLVKNRMVLLISFFSGRPLCERGR